MLISVPEIHPFHNKINLKIIALKVIKRHSFELLVAKIAIKNVSVYGISFFRESIQQNTSKDTISERNIN